MPTARLLEPAPVDWLEIMKICCFFSQQYGMMDDIHNFMSVHNVIYKTNDSISSLRWRHNECDGVSNHLPHDCLFNRLFRRRSKKTSVTGEFPAQRPVTLKMFLFDDVIMRIHDINISISFHKNVHITRQYETINTLRPRQNGRHFPDDIFKCISLNENVWISIKISLYFVPRGPINNITALVQIMAWRRPGDKPLCEPMVICLLTHIRVARPQWVKITHVLYWIWSTLLTLPVVKLEYYKLTRSIHRILPQTNTDWLVKNRFWHWNLNIPDKLGEYHAYCWPSGFVRHQAVSRHAIECVS